MIPKLQITPISTTPKDSAVALKERKNKKRMIADSKKEINVNHSISCFTLSANTVRINGSPLKCKVVLCSFSKAAVNAVILFITADLLEEDKIALLIRTLIN